MSLTGSAKLAGIIGWPVSQAFSPRLHGYWLAEHKINGALVPLPVKPEDFATVLRGLRLAGFKGVSVTVPHKEAAFAVADTCDLAAEAAGAANLLIFRDDGKVEARNTDAVGLSSSLVEALSADALKGKAVVLLGAGGAARACVVALAGLGANEIRILNRDAVRAATLGSSLGPRVESKLVAMPLSDWPKAAEGSSLLVNSTSAGMKNLNILDLPLDPLPKDAAVCDIVYNPLQTDLLKRAAARGHKTIDGLGMLMHQGVPAFKAFFGVEPTVTPGLRANLEAALHAR